MLLSLLFVIISILFGWEITRLLPMAFRRLEAVAFSIAVGFSLSAWIVFCLALVAGFAIGLPISMIAIIIVILILQLKLKPHAKISSKPYSKKWRLLAWFIGITITLTLTILTFMSYQFPISTGDWYTNGNVYGDGPLHVALANQLSLGNTIDLVSPVYKQSALTYPLIADFYTAILRRLGASWQLAFILPSLLMILSLAELIFSFGFRLLRSARGAWLSLAMFIFSGSLRGGIILGWILITQGLTAYHAKIGYSIALSTGDQYLNFIFSHPLPQRSYLFGLPIFIVIVSIALSMYREFGPKVSKKVTRNTAIITGALAGLMPFIHVHSFLVIVGVFGLTTIALLIWKRSLPYGWLWMLAATTLIAFPQLLWQVSHSFQGKFTHFITGWMMQNFVPITNMNLLYFWATQIGVLLLIMLFGWFWLRRYKATPEIWITYAVGCSIFVICNFYAFQPSLWDNMKLFNYGFWAIMLVTAYIFAIWSRKLFGLIIVSILMFSLCIYGFLNLVVTGPNQNFELISKADYEFGMDMQSKLPANAYVLVGDRHSHPITMLANRKVLMSYSGWYNLYGADWEQVLSDRTTMLTGGSTAKQLISKYSLTDAVFSDTEVSNNEANLTFYQDNYKLVTHEDGWWVFNLKAKP